jgi:predicted metal-dependent hydrolase
MKWWIILRDRSLESFKEVIKKILDAYRLQLGVDEDVKIKIRRYRTRAAFSNIKTKTIYINKELLDLGEETLKYLILHELIHIKLNTKYHNGEFHSILSRFISPEEITIIRRNISERLLKIKS